MINENQLTESQKKIIEALLKWIKESPNQYVALGGYAGTGKTTLLSILRSKLDKNLKIAFCSYTGKATQVLKRALTDQLKLNKNDNISTIHSLIYAPIFNSEKEIVGWKKANELKYNLIIVDEASMIDEPLWNDLKSFGINIVKRKIFFYLIAVFF
jgi:tRNA(Met) C34 N-acetyltransferase TmcA